MWEILLCSLLVIVLSSVLLDVEQMAVNEVSKDLWPHCFFGQVDYVGMDILVVLMFVCGCAAVKNACISC